MALLSRIMLLHRSCTNKGLPKSLLPYKSIKINVCKYEFHSLQQPKAAPILQYGGGNSIRNFLSKPDRVYWKMENLKEIDNVPPHAELIYNNRMYKYIFAGQVMSSVCFAAMLMLMFVISTMDYKHDVREEYNGESDSDSILIYFTILAVFCFSMQLMVQQVPIRIYRLANSRQNIFVFYGKMPLKKKKITCKDFEITKVEDGTGILPWRFNRYTMKESQRVILFDYYFRTPSDLNVMLGYQEPVDE